MALQQEAQSSTFRAAVVCDLSAAAPRCPATVFFCWLAPGVVLPAACLLGMPGLAAALSRASSSSPNSILISPLSELSDKELIVLGVLWPFEGRLAPRPPAGLGPEEDLLEGPVDPCRGWGRCKKIQ